MESRQSSLRHTHQVIAYEGKKRVKRALPQSNLRRYVKYWDMPPRQKRAKDKKYPRYSIGYRGYFSLSLIIV